MENLSFEELESLATNSSIAYGKIYYDNGYVSGLKIINDKFIEASVSGTKKYNVFMELRDGVYNSWCTCPYDSNNFCKHKVAVLMAMMDKSHSYSQLEISRRKEKILRIKNRIKEKINRLRK